MRYSIDFVGGGTIVDDMRNITGAIERLVADLNGSLKTSLDVDNWTAEAQQVWQQSQTDWNNGAQNMRTQLDSACTGFGNIMMNYQTTDNRVRNMWAQ
ncbi:WXG100 family type VII secretion target [Frankia sp. CiP3]|uniref:WXG100 family type VII secretion target n=1 Tax=Frankia sp. CiP3 TaxID=2880971 RepID=UPI001EF4F9E8|nr:hypothetical protein [Frankia sp. CiP3]